MIGTDEEKLMNIEQQRLASIEEAIDSEIAATEARKSNVLEAIDELALQLVSAPEDAELQKQIAALEADKDRLERRIQHFQRARAEQQRSNTVASKEAEIKTLHSELAAISRRNERMQELGPKLARLYESAAPLLVEYEALARENQASAHTIIYSRRDVSSDALRHKLQALVGKVKGVSARIGVIQSLWSSGLGRVGIPLQGWVEIDRCAGDPDEAVAKDFRDALTVLTKEVEHREAELRATMPALRQGKRKSAP